MTDESAGASISDATGLSRMEQETTVTMVAGEDVARIWSCYPPHIRRMRGDDRFTEHPSRSGAIFTIGRGDFDPIGGVKRRVSAEQRAAMSERMKARLRARQEGEE